MDQPSCWLDNASNKTDILVEYAKCQETLSAKTEHAAAEPVDDWEDLSEEDSSSDICNVADLLPWYNVSFLLTCRSFESSARIEDGCLVARKVPAAKNDHERAKTPDVVASVRDVSGEGMALLLSPMAAANAGYGDVFTGVRAARGNWEEVEVLPWTLLQPDGPPSWSSHGNMRGASCRWRVHVVDASGNPKEFHAGNRNSCSFTDGAGSWNSVQLRQGIMNVELQLHRGTPLHACVGTTRTLACDRHEVRNLVFADSVKLCIEHRRPESGLHCLCPEALADAAASDSISLSDVMHWDSSADYMASWRVAVELEAAATAADEGDTRFLYNVNIAWGSQGHGSFAISGGHASAHRMKLRGLIRGQDGPTEWASAWLCIYRPSKKEKLGTNWSGHAAVVDIELLGDNGEFTPLAVTVGEDEAPLAQAPLKVSFQIKRGASDPFPKEGSQLDGYVIEFIPKSLPYTCMAVALAELSNASTLLKEVILSARAPLTAQWLLDEASSRKRDKCNTSLTGTMDLAAWKLNHSQEIAVRASLREDLSLIHGPPGTGKTTTAASLCVLYALHNLDSGRNAAVLYCTPSNDAADVACRRVAESSACHVEALATRRRNEVAASNDNSDCPICFCSCCDTITLCGHSFHQACLQQTLALGNRGCPLCRRPLKHSNGSLVAVRVYSAEMERVDFPVPKRIDHPSAKPRQPRSISESMRPYALHWRCHGLAPGVEPTPESLLAGEAYQRLLQAGLGSPAFDDLRFEYQLSLAWARAAEIRRADCIFATCISARRGGLSAALQAEGHPELLQVVLDEAGQAPEPEALCPLTLARDAERIVFVGDPKQLRPIIKSPLAKKMGMSISLLERLSNAPCGQPLLLTLQYRMHADLNAFPAAYFYGGKVRTDPKILDRAPGFLAHPQRPDKSVALLFWGMTDGPSEQVSQVRTAAANAKSRCNVVEAACAARLARSIAALVGVHRVAVLTWYNAQVAQLVEQLHGSGIYAGGVVTSQGNEWDYVILSTVRNAPGSLGALDDEHLLDVALTRARFGMCVLGTAAVLKRNAAWACFLDHCEATGAVTSVQPATLSTRQ
eukprot:TRINITY_DN16520_c0_g3_i1.p1 TRINITY_DN16520_c0_g3~~TRINITY_DN16520_c0_g3_i1.p1  ORF type:complete len:1076 (+),score=105.08 TRINITY_DN16520_c0_g3_i1:50-3277(+)